MWPLLLDMTKEESLQSLRCLELEAYSSLITALRAQGPLSSEKIKVLRETCALLNITQDRHKAEVRRVVNDEKLNTIAYHVSGQRTTNDEWAMEGRRLCPLMPRVAPQTAFSAIADELADSTSKLNKQLPSPSSTERKRTPVSVVQCPMPPEPNKTMFRIPEPPKLEDSSKKRKIAVGVENSSLAQHLLGSPKMSRIQQIYRQKTKARQKEQHIQMKMKQEQDMQNQKLIQPFPSSSLQKIPQKISTQSSTVNINSPKINILQNITVPPLMSNEVDCSDQKLDVNSSSSKMLEKGSLLSQPSSTIENSLVKTKPLLSNSKLSQHITLKHVPSSSTGPSNEIGKTLKVCPARKAITTKSVAAGQKLIVVSNPQSVTNPSILHRTLTIPFVKNLSMKNFDKFKIVNPTSSTIQLTPISSTITTNSAKHKVVTVRTNQAVKKVIPLSQLQVLNAKGGIKVLPIGGKIVTKSNPNSTTAPIFIVNTANSVPALTKSTTSTPPVVMSCKMEDSKTGSKSDLHISSIEKSRISICNNLVNDIKTDELPNGSPQEVDSKLSILQVETALQNVDSKTGILKEEVDLKPAQPFENDVNMIHESVLEQQCVPELASEEEKPLITIIENSENSNELPVLVSQDIKEESIKDEIKIESVSVEVCQNVQTYQEVQSVEVGQEDIVMVEVKDEIVVKEEELLPLTESLVETVEVAGDNLNIEESQESLEQLSPNSEVKEEDQNSMENQIHDTISLPTENSTIYLLEAEQDNNGMLNSYQIPNPADVLDIIGVNHDQSNEKYVLENTECESMETDIITSEETVQTEVLDVEMNSEI